MNTFSKTFKSDTKYLKDIRTFISMVTNKAGFSKEDNDNILLAVGEACTNVMRHAYCGDTTKDIIINCEEDKEKLTISITDFGKKPDVSKLECSHKEKLRRGGYGVICIKSIMDDVSYDLSPEKGTILKLIKNKSRPFL